MKRSIICGALLFVACAQEEPVAPPATATAGAESSDAALAQTDPEAERLFAYHCETCHGDGAHRPGTDALRLKYGGAIPEVLAERNDLSADYVRYVVRRGVNAMPFFRKTEISDEELDLIAGYLDQEQ